MPTTTISPPFSLIIIIIILLLMSLLCQGSTLPSTGVLSTHAGHAAALGVEQLRSHAHQMVYGEFAWGWRGRRMIGSTAPTCTYNECRGCRFKCSAEQVPVDANDPINSAYRYRCVCHW